MNPAAKCPHCGHKLPAGKSKLLPDPKRERLESRLGKLRAELNLVHFEQGINCEEERSHRAGLLNAKKGYANLRSAEKRLRLEIAAVERLLRGAAGGKVLG